MHAVVITEPGGPEVLQWTEVPDPVPGPGEVLIDVTASAVNRADMMQRQGFYPPPKGAAPYPGLECSGTIAAIGAGVTGWQAGDQVCALLAGGGYAEKVTVPAGQVLPAPKGTSLVEAAALPETVCTVYSNVFLGARLAKGETLLIHGGGSGIGTAATTLCKLAGMRVLVTAGSDEKCARCLEHGADIAINYKTEDFAEKAKGVDVILDHIGARYLPRDLQALAMGGRVVLIGSMGGSRTAEIDVTSLLGKRQQIIGSTLRARPVHEKAALVAAFIERFGDDLRAGRIKPVISDVMPIERVADAHRKMNASEHFGKIVLRIT